MTQITEDYCSYETAKLLKEKGFNSLCTAYYDCFTTDKFHYGNEPTDFNSLNTKIRKIVAAPTLQMALKWGREVHKLYIYAKPYWPQGDMRNKMSWQGFIVDLNTINGDSHCYADSYEEAIENRIRFTLENLI